MAVGFGARNEPAGRGPGPRSGFRGALYPPPAQRAHAARSLPVDESGVAPRGSAAQAPHPHIAGVGNRHHDRDAGRGGAEAGHRAVPVAPGAGGCGAGSGGGVVSSRAGCARDAVFPLRGHARAAQEPAGAGRGLARSAAASPRGTGAGRAAARGFRRSGGRAGLADHGRSSGRSAARALFGRAGFCLPIAVRRLWPAGAGGHAVRRLRDCLAGGGGSGGRRGGLRRHPPGTGASHARSGGAAGVAGEAWRALSLSRGSFPGSGRPA